MVIPGVIHDDGLAIVSRKLLVFSGRIIIGLDTDPGFELVSSNDDKLINSR